MKQDNSPTFSQLIVIFIATVATTYFLYNLQGCGEIEQQLNEAIPPIPSSAKCTLDGFVLTIDSTVEGFNRYDPTTWVWSYIENSDGSIMTCALY